MANPFHGKVRSRARSAFLAAIGTAIRDQPLAHASRNLSGIVTNGARLTAKDVNV